MKILSSEENQQLMDCWVWFIMLSGPFWATYTKRQLFSVAALIVRWCLSTIVSCSKKPPHAPLLYHSFNTAEWKTVFLSISLVMLAYIFLGLCLVQNGDRHGAPSAQYDYLQQLFLVLFLSRVCSEPQTRFLHSDHCVRSILFRRHKCDIKLQFNLFALQAPRRFSLSSPSSHRGFLIWPIKSPLPSQFSLQFFAAPILWPGWCSSWLHSILPH